MAWLAPYVVHIRWMEVLRATPTRTLLVMETYLNPLTPHEVVLEIRDRAQGGTMSAGEVAALIPVLVRDLGDDDIPLNADTAAQLLTQYGLQGHNGVYTALYAALDSVDAQKRQWAAQILRRLPKTTPTDRLMEVTYEGLRDDENPWGPLGRLGRSNTFLRNAWSGHSFFKDHPHQAIPWLERGLQSDEWQQQQLCAMVILEVRIEELLQPAVDALIARLADNDVYEDASRSRETLMAFGPDIIPMIEEYVHADDKQLRRHAQLIIDVVRRQARETEDGQLQGAE